MTPHDSPQKKNNNYKITDPPEMFFSRFHLTGFVQVDLAFIIPLDLTVDRLPSWPRISISFSAMLADPGSLETMVHFSVGYVHWVSTLVVLKVMVWVMVWVFLHPCCKWKLKPDLDTFFQEKRISLRVYFPGKLNWFSSFITHASGDNSQEEKASVQFSWAWTWSWA